jgi:hypothetical protein
MVKTGSLELDTLVVDKAGNTFVVVEFFMDWDWKSLEDYRVAVLVNLVDNGRSVSVAENIVEKNYTVIH